MNITQKYLPVGTKRRSGALLDTVRFIVAHDTGNPESTALGNVNYYTKSADTESASAHTFVDDSIIIECIPQTEKAWHVRYNILKDNELFGDDANDCAIGIELCFFPSDLARTQKSYENYVEYIASLMFKYGLDAKTGLVGHYLLDPTRRTDPLNAFKYLNKDWADFENDVTVAIEKLKPVVIPEEPAKQDAYCAPTITTEKKPVWLDLVEYIISLFFKKK